MPTLEELQALGAQPVAAAQPAPASGLTLEQLQAMGAQPYEEPAPPEPSTLSALGRGALQGASFGFADEIAGLIGKLQGKDYATERDAVREANAAAQRAHPLAYGGGEIGAGLATAVVPGLGVAKGASALKVGLQGAGLGALSAAGSSEATDASGIARDVGEGAAVGGVGGAALHVLGGKLAGTIERSPELADEQALRALAGSESSAGSARWSKARALVKDPQIRSELTQAGELGGKQTSLRALAGKSTDEVRAFVAAQKERIGSTLDAIYDATDGKSGGMRVSNIVDSLDARIAKLSATPGNQPFVKALEDTRADVLRSWAPQLTAALKADEASVPAVRAAILKSLDVAVPSKDVRAFASTLQERGSESIDRLNPGVATQAKRYLGSTVRDIVNEHVESALGAADAEKLKAANARMASLYRLDDVLAERADKEAAGRMSGRGLLEQTLGHGSLVGAGVLAMHGNIPGAVAAAAAPVALKAAPAAIRTATRGLAHADELLKQVAISAASGNPWAQAQLRLLRSTPQGLARLATAGLVGASGDSSIGQESMGGQSGAPNYGSAQ